MPFLKLRRTAVDLALFDARPRSTFRLWGGRVKRDRTRQAARAAGGAARARGLLNRLSARSAIRLVRAEAS